MYYKIGYNRTITQTNHEISGNGSEEGSSHLEVNTEVPAHGLGGCNASQRNTMESEYQMKPQMYETRRKPSAAELTLGGVGRLPRVLHLEPKASAAARQESVRARPNPWRQQRRNTSAREKMGEGGSHHGWDRRAEASRRMGGVCGGGEVWARKRRRQERMRLCRRHGN